MKKPLIVAVVIFLSMFCSAQDVIFLKSGQTLKVKVLQMFPDSIRYSMADDTTHLVKVMSRKYIADLEINSSLPVNKETGKVIYTEVVKVNKSATEIYNVAKEWFSTNPGKFFKSTSLKGSVGTDAIWGTKKKTMADTDLKFKSENKVSLDDPVEKKLIGHGVIKYFGSSYGNVRTVYISYDIKILARENKYKYEISNFNIEHYNPYTEQKCAFGTLSDKGPCQSTGSLENLLTCDSCKDALKKLFTTIDQEVLSMIQEMKDYITKPISSESW